jgi:calcium-dependent protein kinase
MGASYVKQEQEAEDNEIEDAAMPSFGRIHKDSNFEDEYIVLPQTLGSGKNGVVHLAVKKTDPMKKFAFKRLNLVHHDKELLDDIAIEVQNHVSVDHPHIAKLYDVYETQDHIDLFVEHLDGGELFDRVSDKPQFSEEEASDTLSQILSALKYLHSHGIVHRDVKLENLVYEEKGGTQLKLIDFGLSAAWNSQSADNLTRCCGTIAYCAPEVFRGSYTSQCDMWSLGVVGYILLTGRMPFFGAEHVQHMNICAGRYSMSSDRWSNISAEAKDFIVSLLTLDPNKRLTAEQALQHPWIARCNHDKADSCMDRSPRQVDHSPVAIKGASLHPNVREGRPDCYNFLDVIFRPPKQSWKRKARSKKLGLLKSALFLKDACQSRNCMPYAMHM